MLQSQIPLHEQDLDHTYLPQKAGCVLTQHRPDSAGLGEQFLSGDLPVLYERLRLLFMEVRKLNSRHVHGTKASAWLTNNPKRSVNSVW